MKPSRFCYLDPETVEEAIALVAQHGDEASVLAGGQSLVPMLSMRLAYPSFLVDLNGIGELDYVRRDDGGLTIGALTRQATGEGSAELRECCPLIAEALPLIGHRAIRNRGTFGGSLAHADPAAELPAVMTALGASVTAASSRGEREIPVGELFEMPLVSRLESDELLTSIHVPAQPDGAGSAVVEIARRHGDFALAGVAAAAVLDRDRRVSEVRLASFGTGPTPIRLRESESLVSGSEPHDQLLADAGVVAGREISPSNDVHASADYRRRVTGVLVRRALKTALERAGAKGEGQR